MFKKRSEKSSTGNRRARFFLSFLAYGLTLCVVALAGTFWWSAHKFHEAGPLTETRLFMVERGEGLRTISKNLHTQGLINAPYIFTLSAMVSGAHNSLKAGEYEIQAAMSQHDILTLLQEGKTFARRFTIPEGRTSFETIEILKATEGLTGEIATIPPEGSLLPNTYDYQRDETRERALGRMQQAMTDTLAALWPNRDSDLPFTTPEEAITLASIIEKETGAADERKRVAGVFINRLRRGIPLQSDPTVIYGITKGRHQNEGKGPIGRRLLSKDLKADSPYNTYKNPGLPPGPIANPGVASIEAALHPEKHDFIYFVADGQGGHIFAKTLAEHNKNVAQWRKIRKMQE
ncbi:MAG: endolytic transglycosylase MltG [Alphaproteobacteria bacterium]|nr:endolytic transglycosylase MltG [Alphaproteobacteria bacterium]